MISFDLYRSAGLAGGGAPMRTGTICVEDDRLERIAAFKVVWEPGPRRGRPIAEANVGGADHP